MTRKSLDLNFLPRPPSHLQTTDSPTSPLSPQSPSPLTAPPPLHLRTLLSPPLPPAFLSTAPPLPYPWIWKCHLCNNIYRLGVTRRCLEDGHFFCSLPSPPTSPVHKVEVEAQNGARGERDEETRLGKGFEHRGEQMAEITKQWEIEREKKRKRRRARKGGARGCRSEFDYKGWSKYNIWRREVRAIKYGQKLDSGHRITEMRHWESPIDDGEGSGLGKKTGERDCWRDCDFPSECLNERKVEREWVAQREKMRELEEEWARERERLRGEFEGTNTEAHVIEDEMDVDITFYDAEEKQGESEGVKEMEDGMRPLGTDCDGLGEEGYQSEMANSRRKSLDAVAESPPSSPLKSCSFGFEDVDMGCDVWAGEKGKGDEDVQVEEGVKTRSMILRSCKKGNRGKKSGDEDDNVL